MNDQDGFRLEAADQFGFAELNDFPEDAGKYLCTEAQLIAFAKACERKGMAEAYELANRDAVHRRMKEIDAELAPILKTERDRALGLCDDEGCPHHGTDHVCISRTTPLP